MPILTSNASEVYKASVSVIAVVSIFIIIRFAIKLGRRQTLQGPDWLCLVAAVILNLYCGFIINFIFNVSQCHAFDLDVRLGAVELTNLAKFSYINELLYGPGITAVKLSILWFYYNLFSVDQALRRVIQAASVVCIIWLIVISLVVAFQCNPVEEFWKHPGMSPHCVEFPRVLLGYETSNLLIDVAILGIPTGTVLRLQLPWIKKVPIIGVFLSGALVCIFSILRLCAIWNPPDIINGFNFTGVYIWSVWQLAVAIITSCLLTFGPLLSLLSKSIDYFGTWFTVIRYKTTSSQSRIGEQSNNPTTIGRPYPNVGNDKGRMVYTRWDRGNEFDDLQYHSHPPSSQTILVNGKVDVV
ncbi:hypothetical protein F4777DRAFT_590929 [Nemania sp. FL0916]|nr:hypothetical protein F4777DRAFT_590929 [Nemania sp. FL0916]